MNWFENALSYGFALLLLSELLELQLEILFPNHQRQSLSTEVEVVISESRVHAVIASQLTDCHVFLKKLVVESNTSFKEWPAVLGQRLVGCTIVAHLETKSFRS